MIESVYVAAGLESIRMNGYFTGCLLVTEDWYTWPITRQTHDTAYKYGGIVGCSRTPDAVYGNYSPNAIVHVCFGVVGPQSPRCYIMEPLFSKTTAIIAFVILRSPAKARTAQYLAWTTCEGRDTESYQPHVDCRQLIVATNEGRSQSK
eukprot:scaffold396311_cov17-Prasinocladus_malaysianus.AAC.2